MKEKTSLKNKAICGIFWSAVERFLSQGIQFVVTVIINLVLGIIAKEFKTITIDKILVISTN